jgi:hypothetical protein
MVIRICKSEGCENLCEGNTDQCATHNHMDRKAAREALKEKKVYQIPKISKKLAREQRKYSGPGGTREQHLSEHPICQLKLQVCTGKATQIHHSARRGKNLNNKETFLSACAECHDFVEFRMSAAECREKGFLK